MDTTSARQVHELKQASQQSFELDHLQAERGYLAVKL
jgi:hypothetical protein